MSEYIPSPRQWVAEQVELYEGSGGTAGLTLRDTGLPVIIVTHRGRKTGAVRKTPLMRVMDGRCYILVASQGGAPEHPVWYHNLKADPRIEIRDQTEVHERRAREVIDPAETRRKVIASRERLAAELAGLGFEVLPSAANFVFARHPGHDAAALSARLRERSIIVRHFKAARIDQFLRITVGTDAQCVLLVEALQEILG